MDITTHTAGQQEAGRRSGIGISPLARADAGVFGDSVLFPLLQQWPGVLFRQRADFSFEFISPKIAIFTGVPVPEWLKETNWIWQVVHEADVESLRQRWLGVGNAPEGVHSAFRLRHIQTARVSYMNEFRYALRDGRGAVVGYAGFWQDVTRQTISERRLAAAAWKETLAVLTMGLAHDFNNVMSGILALSESFLLEMEESHPFYEGVRLIKINALQAGELVQRIVNLHHGQTGNRTYLDLRELVSDTIELLQKVINRRITISHQSPPESVPLFADGVELRQLIVNMALNAADAMPGSGTLTFRTSRHEELPLEVRFYGSPPRWPAACLSIEDTGMGIKATHLASIFDPFFTTKARNKGCGLGLYNARVFVEKHAGAISVESREGVGTAFGVWLPIADFTEAEQHLEQADRRRRSLLLLSRDATAAETVSEFLRLHSYQVLIGGSNAEELLQSGEYSLDGLIILVEGNDTEFFSLAARVRQEKLPVKVIIQIIGCNQDEVETRHLLRADLIVSEEMPEDLILRKLAALFDPRSS